MGLRLHTNLPSLTVQTNLYKHTADVNTHLSRLSSGLRVASSADDPGTYSMIERFRAKGREVAAATRAVESGESMTGATLYVTDKALDHLSSMRALAVSAMDETLTDEARSALSAEWAAHAADIEDLIDSEYNGLAIAKGGGYSVYAGSDDEDEIDWVSPNLDSSTFTLFGGFDLSNPVTAKNLISFLDNASTIGESYRSGIAGAHARLGFARSALQQERDATATAQGRIEDADVAEETAGYTRAAVLQAGSVALLAQANVAPERALLLIDTMGI